jgi:hypothetical protein
MRIIFFGVLLLLLNKAASAQTIDEINSKFPGEMAVITKADRETKITLKDGVPVANSFEEFEFMITDSRANGLYNRHYVYHGSFNQLSDLEAYTKVRDGSKFKKIKVGETKTESSISSSVFYDDVKETFFDFPSLIKGAVAYESHKEYHPDPHLLTPFYFRSYMPVMETKYSVVFPSDVQVKYIIKNDPDNIINVRQDKKGKQQLIEFSANNLKARKTFSNSPASAYYEPHVIVYISGYKDDDGNMNSYLDSLSDLYKWNFSFLKNINQQQDSYIKHLADSLTSTTKTDKEKVRQIYKWVQQQIKYVAFEDGLEGFVPRQAADVCTKRYGDCKDMASLLTALLQAVNLDAHFTWIGTRDIPYTYTEVHLPIVDNHMISAVKVTNEWIFLDATDPNCEFGIPTSGIQGKEALIAFNEDHYEVVKVPEINADRNVLLDSTFIKVAANGITGKIRVQYSGYPGNDLHNRIMYQDQKNEREMVKGILSKGNNKFTLGNYHIAMPTDGNNNIKVEGEFEIPEYGKKLADEYYINLNLDKFYTSAVIDTTERKVAVEYKFKNVISQYTELEMPEGYTVSYIPKDFSLNNDLLEIHIIYKKESNKIICYQQVKNKMMFLESKYFPVFNKAIQQLLNQYKEQLVLVKIK